LKTKKKKKKKYQGKSKYDYYSEHRTLS
jgi:hypothetical protein